MMLTAYWREEIKVILISQKDFTEKAKLELCFGRQGELETLCEGWTGQRRDSLSKLRTTNDLVKTPGLTIACHDVGHMCIHQILLLEMPYVGPVKIQPVSFGFHLVMYIFKSF